MNQQFYHSSEANSRKWLLIIVTIFLPSLIHGYDTIQAESYAEMNGIQLENNETTVGFFDQGDWIRYDQVEFGTGPAAIVFSIAKGSTGGMMEIRLDSLNGPLIATCVPEATSSWVDFQEQTWNLESTSGTHNVFLIARAASGVCNLDYFRLTDQGVYEPDWVLQWSDEFNGTDVDTTVWRKVYHGNPDNGELQFYTPRQENIQVSNGTLKLIARVETFTGQGPWMPAPVTRYYTSGKIESQGKLTFQYGKIEASMKLPRGKGTWPAFWMLGENLFDPGVGWPRCGEIDIMEHGQDFDHLGAALHTEAYNHTIGTQITGTYQIDDYDTGFHVYGVEWDSDKMRFYVDGNVYMTATKEVLGSTIEEWPFDQPFWLILNHAVGGAWGGTPVDSLYPHTVEVDWVRVYQDQAQPTSLLSPEKEPIDFTVSPNPARGSVQVIVERRQSRPFDIEILDIHGRTCIRGRFIQSTILPTETLPAGMYKVLLRSDRGVLASRSLLIK